MGHRAERDRDVLTSGGRPSLPRDVRQSLPRGGQSSPPQDVRRSLPRGGQSSPPQDVRRSLPRGGLRFPGAAALVAAAIACAPAAARGDGAAPAPAAQDARPAARPVQTTLLPAHLANGAGPVTEAPSADLAALLAELDELLAGTARDLGLAPDTAPAPAAVPEAELLDLARRTGRTVIAAAVRDLHARSGAPGEASAGADSAPAPDTAGEAAADVELHIALASPARRSLVTRAERFRRGDLAVRAVVMLRDVVTDAGLVDRPKPALPVVDGARPQMAAPAHSEGRVVLAVNATVLGGLMGLSVERASGSNDPRLLYPLLAVGAGVGLGASLLIAEEWDVGTGDAWFLSSGGIWPTAAAHLLWEGRFGAASGRRGQEGERWTFGLAFGTAGITFSTLSLALGDMSSGGAILAHSGGAIGLGLGGLTEWFVRGDTRDVPFAGMGYGAALGWLAAAGAATTRVHLPAGRVLSVDLGAVLGGLAGAALAVPLVFDGPTSTETRGWLGAIGGGAVVGAGVALWLTRGATPAKPNATPSVKIAAGTSVFPELPEIGVIGESTLDGPGPRLVARPASAAAQGALEAPAPIFGVRFRGRW